MPISKDIELVKALALEIGIRPAARKLGVNEDTACSWADRYGWDISGTKPGPENSASRLQANPIDVLQATLAARKQESRAKLSEYQVRAATEAAAHEKPLSITRQVNDLASIHSKVWPEEQNTVNAFSLNVLNLTMFDSTDT